VSDQAREGWFEDPARRHEYRWFSQGVPTDLVKDGTRTSRDALSISDPSVYESMDLQRPPDVGPLLHDDDKPEPHFELIGFGGEGNIPVVMNTAASDYDSQAWSGDPAALAEQAALGAPRPYRPEPGEAVYGIWADGMQVQVAERDLRWPLRELVIAVLEEGE